MFIRPPITKKRYNHQLPGIYGQFGSGAGVRAFYLQSVLTPVQLDWISLIGNIRECEHWPVRDLFRCDIDNDRISDSLLPYLRDTRKIKFFNPLTLTLLPIEENSGRVLSQMPRMVESSMQQDGYHWEIIDTPNHHSIRWVKDKPHYAVLEWSDIRTKLVAIDGQHRISALRRFWNDHESAADQSFRTWHIPVVVVSFRMDMDGDESLSILEAVRSTFVYIDTEAKPINKSRNILLSDESVNAICTQELVQLAHSNDLLPLKERSPRRLPLLFYDWRIREREKQRNHAPASVKGVEEIYKWFRDYILGEDFSVDQEAALGVDSSHSLHGAFYDKKLDHRNSRELRKIVHKDLLPAVTCLLENFTPYHLYVKALRELEHEYENQKQSDLARHALHELRFGTNHAPESIKPKVRRLFAVIKDRIEVMKSKWLHEPFDLDLGMRGVICAFGMLRRCFHYPEWMEYAEWFVEALNRVYENGWIDLRPRAKRRDFLLCITDDHNEVAVNYKLEDTDMALGAYLQLLVTAYGHPLPETWRNKWSATKHDLLDNLSSRILSRCKKQVLPQLRENYPDGGKPLTEAMNRKAEELMGRQIRRFERELDRIERTASRH